MEPWFLGVVLHVVHQANVGALALWHPWMLCPRPGGVDRQGSPVRFPYIGITGLRAITDPPTWEPNQVTQVAQIHTGTCDAYSHALKCTLYIGVYMIGFESLGIDR